MSDIQSHLARHVPRKVTSDGELRAMGARAWADHETLVVRLSVIQDPIIRGMVVAVADYLGFRRR